MVKKSKLPVFPETVNILGTIWKIEVRKYDDDPYFKENGADGYCSNPEKLIVLLDPESDKSYSGETELFISEVMKEALRHEITHAYFYESGLGANGFRYAGPWCRNEEMVDWIAKQGEKIVKTWTECKCLIMKTDPETWMKSKKQEEKKDDSGRL